MRARRAPGDAAGLVMLSVMRPTERTTPTFIKSSTVGIDGAPRPPPPPSNATLGPGLCEQVSKTDTFYRAACGGAALGRKITARACKGPFRASEDPATSKRRAPPRSPISTSRPILCRSTQAKNSVTAGNSPCGCSCCGWWRRRTPKIGAAWSPRRRRSPARPKPRSSRRTCGAGSHRIG
jgi:hypothetical protein